MSQAQYQSKEAQAEHLSAQPSNQEHHQAASPACLNSICLHCGLPVPAYRLLGSATSQEREPFCCNGCQAVYKILKANKLEYYYRLQEESGNKFVPAHSAPHKHDLTYFDSLEFQELHLRRWKEQTGSATDEKKVELAAIELFLEGVHCSACVWLLERLPQMCPGIHAVRVDLGRSTAEVVFIPAQIKLSAVIYELGRYGYRAHPYRGANTKELRKLAERRLISALGVAGACAGNVMIISISLYSGLFQGMDLSYWNFFRWAALLLTLPALLFSGRIFYQRAFAAFRLRQIHLDLPITIGLWAGFIGSAINTARGAGEVYFDSINLIIFLLLISRFLQFRAQNRAVEKAELMFSLVPASVHRKRDGVIQECPLDSVEVGDTLEVRTGERIPIDGIVTAGESSIDLSILTGEPEPVPVKAGDRVFAGASNRAAPIMIEVTSVGEQTRIGRLAQLATEIHRAKPPILHLVDRLSKWFVLFVLTMATAALLLGWIAGGFEQGFERVLALLIISCPCALGMATPLALSVGLGNAARVGIHLRNTAAIEAVAQSKHLVFDKTGTVTKGEFRVHRWWGDKNLIPVIIAIEEQSGHPIARALVRELKAALDVNVLKPDVIKVEQQERGMIAQADGSVVQIGSLDFIEAKGINPNEEVRRAVNEFSSQGLTSILVASNDTVRSIIGLGDVIKDGAIEVLSYFQKAGFTLHLLSGDNTVTVQRVASLVGISPELARGGAGPEQKRDYIRSLQAPPYSASSSASTVVMFGDGVNDAAALAQADVGVGVHGGAEASFLVADGFFSRPDFSLFQRLVEGSIATVRTVRVALLISLLFNLTGASLAVLGAVSPLVAAVLMPVSSLIVISLAFMQRSYLTISLRSNS